MNGITYHEEKEINLNSLLELYNDAGWITYTNNIKELSIAIKNSLYVITARSNDKLVGLLRAVGDGKTILYIQDILVHSEYKRNRIGYTLMTKTLARYKNIRQKVLLTDENEETRGFYQALGFISCDKGKLVAFAKFKS